MARPHSKEKKEAIEKGLIRYFTGKPCKHGHIAERLVSNDVCVACNRNTAAKRNKTQKRKDWTKTYLFATVRGRASLLLRSARYRSRLNGNELSIDIDWIREKVAAGFCEATGIPFSLAVVEEKGGRDPFAPSIDRIDSSIGYTKENCRMVVTIYNYAKNEFSDADVRKMALAISGIPEMKESA